MKNNSATVDAAKRSNPFTPEVSKRLDTREVELKNGHGTVVADLTTLWDKVGSGKPK